MNNELPVWRSLMCVPVNVGKYVDKAHTRGADCIQLDLEDSVPLQPDEDVLLHPKQRMIIVRAQKLLSRHEAIKRREATTLAASKSGNV